MEGLKSGPVSCGTAVVRCKQTERAFAFLFWVARFRKALGWPRLETGG